MWSVQPMDFITSGHGPGCIVVPALSHGVMSDEYAWAPPHICWHSGASLPVQTCPDCKT